MSLLDDAAAAIRRGDYGAALRALLTLWREAPSAALSALDALLAADPPPPSLVALTLPGGAIDIERFSATPLFEQLRELELVGGYTRRQQGLIRRMERVTWVSADNDHWRLTRTPGELELRLRSTLRWSAHEIDHLERVLRDVPWREIERARLIDRGSPFREHLAQTLHDLAGKRLES